MAPELQVDPVSTSHGGASCHPGGTSSDLVETYRSYVNRNTALIDRSGVDIVQVVRGASRGFSVFFIGGLAQPIVQLRAPALAYWWLALVAVAAFAVAAWRACRPAAARTNLWQGSFAAVGSYFLVLPLVLAAGHGYPFVQIASTSAIGVVVGLLVRFVRLRVSSSRMEEADAPLRRRLGR